METKICNKCGVEKTLDNFAFRYDTNKYRNDCKQCKSKYDKIYRETNKERLKKLRQQHYNKEARKEYHKKYYQEHRNKIFEYQKNYRKNNPKRKEYEKKYRELNKDKIAQYRLEHRNQKREQDKKWRERNKDKVKQSQIKRYLKVQNDPILRLKRNLRNMIKDAFKKKKFKKSKKLEEICCCTIDELIEHLINTYEINYNEKWDWSFVNDVHIDHKKPLATAKTEEDIIKLNHYTNLQLLKAKDNLKKGAKLDYDICEC